MCHEHIPRPAKNVYESSNKTLGPMKVILGERSYPYQGHLIDATPQLPPVTLCTNK